MVAFAAGVTAVLQENGVKADDLAGLSLGEYSALQAAGLDERSRPEQLTLENYCALQTALANT